MLSAVYFLQGERHHGSVPVLLIIYRHVAGPVTLNALDEIFLGLVYVSIHVVWTPKFDLLERKGTRSNTTSCNNVYISKYHTLM